MVFPSIPIYLDPSNWNHQQGHHPNINGPVDVEAPSGPPVRPASMADRARIAKVPPPEAALNCPRCDSTNTKFCYFNNYSLSQPRHFCKACRRYWTRGGALRNVPVGGGCRRNKRSKGGAAASSASKSQTTSATSSISSTATGSATMMPAASQQLQFMPSMHPFVDYTTTNMGLNFGGEYQGMEQWRLQQFSVAPGHGLMNQFDGEGGRPDGSGRFGPVLHQQGAGDGVKMEGRSHGLNLARPSLSINDQYWNGGVSGNGGWMMDLSAFNSSSAGNLL